VAAAKDRAAQVNLANNLTVFRILLVPAFFMSLLYYSGESSVYRTVSLFVFLLACVTDGLDGYLARRFDQRTQLGSYIDPLADKILLLSGFISLTFMNHLPEAMRIPAWVTVSVLTRDTIILIGSAVIFLMTGALKAEPLFIGKVTTFFQMTTLFCSLAMAPESLRLVLFGVTVLLTVISGVHYVHIGGRMIQK
jgi:cardiolipin synthase